MAIAYQFSMKLLSDTTFGRGDGVAGLVDQEVEHDPSGFPYLRGRTLKGLISEECDNLIAVMEDAERQKHWYAIAAKLFGVSGSTRENRGELHVGDACLPADLRQAVATQLKQPNPELTQHDVLSSLTTIRRQTAISVTTGAPETNSLRSIRTIIRGLTFCASLGFENPPNDDDDMVRLLAVGAAALRHVGSSRNRGRGQVHCKLLHYSEDDSKYKDITKKSVQKFDMAWRG